MISLAMKVAEIGSHSFLLSASERGIRHLAFGGWAKENQCLCREAAKKNQVHIIKENTPLLNQAEEQLRAYFRGELKEFTVPLDMQGTTFQKLVWRQLEVIPYGETRSYKDIAAAIGLPKSVRAVGGANNKNPLPIFVPCHRVIGSNGSMVGYAGGLPLKEELLQLEKQPETLVY
ncbi:methylated-DNA--[protein]-cysteine S-methyltransferase [Alkalicoccus urumqiensis]|uniref:Methylated-DNA--protein-cysteine methyltransferase n=1 Tax=Alkalicoccus urumqiensis TaxID=1548213 RepID=A0A2P6MEP9_ALKUR|nr:methylated-DNA--[protein]-cysteine S-methyltransferase [Alkalicoccus urumqiensis]PRO64730.1 [Fe-S]-binding protein [Alkalicoccus urumqiensis]